MEHPAAARRPVDARRGRFEQGVVAVVILAGFVFRVPWVLPGLVLVLAPGVVVGPRLHAIMRLYDVLVAPYLSAPVSLEEAGAARLADLIGLGLLVTATVVLLVDLGGLAWIIALAEALAAALRATAGINLAAALAARLHRRA